MKLLDPEAERLLTVVLSNRDIRRFADLPPKLQKIMVLTWRAMKVLGPDFTVELAQNDMMLVLITLMYDFHMVGFVDGKLTTLEPPL